MITGSPDGEKIVIYDNFETDQPVSFSTDFPMKFNFTMTLLITEGEMKVQIDHSTYLIQKNDWAMVLSGKVFQIIDSAENTKATICCSRNEFDVNPDIGHSIDLFNLIRKNPVLHLTKEEMEEYLFNLNRIRKFLHMKEHICRYLVVRSYLEILFYTICQLYSVHEKNKEKKQSRSEELYQSFLFELEKGYKQEKSLKYYANRLCVTPKHLSTVLYQISGKHGSDWIEECIIMEAKALLKSTHMSIQQICYELNFSSSAHFGKFFRRLTGMSPREYRKG